MAKKKILLFLLLGLLMLSFTSAFTLTDPSTWDDSIEFHDDGKYGYYEISDTFLWLYKEAPFKVVKLLENNYSLFKAWNIKEITIFEKTKLYDKTEYFELDKKTDKSSAIKAEQHFYRQLINKTRLIKNIECSSFEIIINNSIPTNICTEWINNSYEEIYEDWTEWRTYNWHTVEIGKYQTKTIVTRNRLTTGGIEWIDTSEGAFLDEWATWWDNSWAYKKQINITETSGNSFTNYSTFINITYDSNMKNDFSDLRFLNSTENGELDYWVENKVNNDYAEIWVKLPSLTASSTQSIYMYYGNAIANSNSNISSAFIYGNIGDNINGWTEDLIGDTILNITDNSIYTRGPVVEGWVSSGFVLPTTYTTGTYRLKYSMKGDDKQREDGARISGFSVADTTPGSAYDNSVPSTLTHDWSSGDQVYSVYDNGAGQIVTDAGFYEWNDITQTVNLDILSNANGANMTIINNSGESTTYINGATRGTMDDIGILKVAVIDSDLYLRNITLREKANTEPTYVFGDEESITDGPRIQLSIPVDNYKSINTTNTFYAYVTTDKELENVSIYFDGILHQTYISPPNATNFSFSRTLFEGNHEWYVDAWDNESQGTNSSTRTILIHFTEPVVNVTEPNGTYGFLVDGGNITLVYNISESGQNITEHLDSCWYVYNNTNNSLNCSSNQTNFTYIIGVNTLTVYAKDIFGLIASDTTTWEYIFKYWDIILTTPQYEGTQGIFILNTSLLSGETISEAIFNYNGTNYSTNIISSAGDYLITASIELPSVENDTNFTLNFYTVVDGIVYNFLNETQEVLNIEFINCTVPGDLLINLSLFDEGSKISILGDVELNLKVHSKTSDGIVAELNNTYENIANQEICLSPNESFSNLYLNAEFRYLKDDYVTEFYHIQKADLEDYPVDLNLFDLKQNDSTEFSVTYKNNNFIFTEGAIIQLLRKYIGENSYEVVEAPVTSDGGETILHIDLNTNKYQASVVKDGELLDFFDNIVFSCDNELSGDCTHSLQGTVDPNNDVLITAITDFSYSVSIDEGNQTITVLFSVPSGTPSKINVVLEQIDMFGNLTACNTTLITSAGSIECNYIDTIEKSILELSISKNDIPLVILSYVNDPELDMDGINFFIVFLFMISLVGMAIASPEWMIIISVMVLLISGTLLLINGMNLVMGLGSIAWVLVVAAILIFKMSKQEDR